MKLIISYIFLTFISVVFGFLSLQNGHFVYNNQKVFLSGANNPWVHYARDFGSGAYASSRAQFEKWLTEVSAAGGNAVRVWLHIDGQWSPKFDAQGFATGEDVNSLITELGQYLDFAQKMNVFVIFCLWNGAVKPQQMLHLYADEAKLDRYLEKVLKPMVSGLKTKRSLAAWEIVNEVGGSVLQNISDPNPCFDTKKLLNSGADWAGSHLTMKNALKFINRHIAAIKMADPKVLVTSGSWNERSNLDVSSSYFNYYKDQCLVAAGGMPNGHLDFYQIHSYVWQGKYGEFSPFKKTFAELKLDKPVVIGEFGINCTELMNATQYYNYAYNADYSGLLNWGYDGKCKDCCDDHLADEGMKAIRDKVKVIIN